MTDSEEDNVDAVEVEETQDGVVTPIPSPPTPPRPRMRENGTAPPELGSLPLVTDGEEGNVDTVEDEETQENMFPPVPNPPTPLRPRLYSTSCVPYSNGQPGRS